MPDCLTLFTLPRLVGLAKAREFLYFNATWDAQQALANGIASKVVADEDVDAEGIAIAQKFAEGPAEVVD